MSPLELTLRPIGRVHSSIRSLRDAPLQGTEGAPSARLQLDDGVLDGLDGVQAGQEILVLTWLHRSRRDVLKVHPRNDTARPLTGVFATRSPDRPNPIGLHRVRVVEVGDDTITVEPLEAIDGTPILDIKPVLFELGPRIGDDAD